MPPDDEITNTATEVDTTEVSPPAKPARLEPGTKLGRYEIGEVLGAGGMGVVYRARDPELGRDVAIKVIGSQGGRSQERLLAEARAMAKLDHPSLMPVFDVGALENGVFVVMPYLTGGTLHDWIHAMPRPWREVVARFIKAGRGLAAAHAAGLVHRDFKPRNVLLDGDDVLVADFGLVAGGADASPGAPKHASTIGGTPGYMAPEQARGEPVDARADQFSFCVSLWEGLHGERPQDAATRTASPLSSTAPPVPPARSDSPKWLRQAVARGFSFDPRDRWAAMGELLVRLAPARRERRRAVMMALVAALALLIAAAVWARTSATETAACSDANRAVEAWSPEIRAAVVNQFIATGVPYARETLDIILPRLDEYATTWRTTRSATCRDPAAKANPSAFDARMNCLERRLAAFVNTLSVFQSADGSIVRKASRSVGNLPPIADCANDRLAAEYALPSSIEKRAQVNALDDELDRSWKLRLEGKSRERLALLERLTKDARTVDHDPFTARVLYAWGREEERQGIDGETHLRESIEAAARANDDVRAARVWAELAEALVETRGRIAEAAALEPVMEAAAARAGWPREAALAVHLSVALIALRQGDSDRASSRLAQARELVASDLDMLVVIERVAAVHFTAGRRTEAIAAVEELLALTERVYGKHHPLTGSALQQLAQVLAATGDQVRQESLLRQALEIARSAQGAEHVDVAHVLISLGNLQRVREDPASAEATLEEAVRILEPSSQRVDHAFAVTSLADAIAENRGFDAAREMYNKALALVEGVGGKDNLRYVMTETNYAAQLVDNGDCASAKPYLEHGIRFLEGIKHPGIAISLSNRAKCDLREGKNASAVAALERSLSLCGTGACPAGVLEGVKELLAVELVKSPATEARALGLAEEVRSSYEKNGRTKSLERFDAAMSKARPRVRP